MQVQFRYSETDFIAYLITLGLQYDKIEVSRTRQGDLRAYVFFTYDEEYLLNAWKDYKDEKLEVNLSSFAKNRKYISKLMQAEKLNHQAFTALDRLKN